MDKTLLGTTAALGLLAAVCYEVGTDPQQHTVAPPTRAELPPQPAPHVPSTFTNSITITVNCGSPDRGYMILAVDGVQVAFVNGDHVLHETLAGTHTLQAWGSCTAT